MTVVVGTFRDIGGRLSQGAVTICSRVIRPAQLGEGQVVTTERHVMALVDGAFVSPELDPGPVRVELSAGGVFEAWDVLLPEDGRHDLATLLESHVEYSPSIVGRVEAAAEGASRSAAAAGRSASAAKQAETRVNKVVSSTAEVLRGELAGEIERVASEQEKASVARVGAEAAAEAAGKAQSAAESAAGSTVEAVRVELRGEVEAAAGSASQAEAHALRAESAASSTADSLRLEMQGYVQAAGVSEGNATASAGQAQLDAGRAGDSAGQAQAAALRAEQAQSSASGDATRAEQAATRAEDSKQAAVTAQQGSEAARDEAVQAAASAKTGAPEAGWARAELAAEVRDSLQRADTALQSVPKATTSAPGTVKLAGDLSGTADNPTVPALENKLDKSSQIWSVYGRDGTSETMISYSKSADANKIAVRDTSGALHVGAPTNGTHATTKAYVDSAVSSSSSKYLLLKYAKLSEMPLPRALAKPIPWVTESGTVTHQHTSRTDGGVLIRETGVYQVTVNFPFIDYYSDKVSYELQVAPPGGSYSTANFALMESSIAWDRSDSMTWPLTLSSSMWVRLQVTCNNGTAGAWNKNKRIKATMLLTKIA